MRQQKGRNFVVILKKKNDGGAEMKVFRKKDNKKRELEK